MPPATQQIGLAVGSQPATAAQQREPQPEICRASKRHTVCYTKSVSDERRSKVNSRTRFGDTGGSAENGPHHRPFHA